MGVNHRRSDVFVTEQLLNRTNVIAVFKQMCGEAVSEGVAACRLSDSGCTDSQFDGVLKVFLRNVMASRLARARIEGRFCGGKKILPDEVARGIGIFSFQSKRQI